MGIFEKLKNKFKRKKKVEDNNDIMVPTVKKEDVHNIVDTKEDIKREDNGIADIKKDADIINNGKHLICDDSDPNRMVLEKYLSRKDIAVDKATNGEEAIEQIKKNGIYKIIWMDIQMPKMNGLDCTRHLRQNIGYKGVIIGLTGYIDQDSINKCMDYGMTHVIGKPINKNILYHYVDTYN